jgi:Right handed beta helix region
MQAIVRLAPILCLLLCLATASASILIVPDDIPTIEDAVDVAVPHDTVLVRTGNHEPERMIEFNEPHVTLLGEGMSNTVVWANFMTLLMRITADSCRVQGLCILMLDSGIAIEISEGDCGGPSTVAGTCIHKNWLYGAVGGGVADMGRIGTRITENTFQGNMGAVQSLSQDPVIAKNEFLECGRWAVRLIGGGLVVANEFHDNWMMEDDGTATWGGGITIVNNDYPIMIEGNRIHHNRTDGWAPEYGMGKGGGIFMYGASEVTVRNNEIWANQALKGAGFYAESSSFLLEGNLFWANHDSTFYPENTQRGYGGSIYALNCSGVINQNTCAHNTALIDGAAVFIENSPNLEFRSNIFTSNSGDGGGIAVVGTAPAQYHCNDAWLSGSANYSGWDDPTGFDGNISADPVFCYPDSGNYHISDDSPCASYNSPSGCDLIGKYDIACSVADVEPHLENRHSSIIRVTPNPVFRNSSLLLEVIWSDHQLSEDTTFWIVDCTGRVLASLPALVDSRGEASARWDGITRGGRPVLSGMYYVRAVSGHTTLSAPLLVIR